MVHRSGDYFRTTPPTTSVMSLPSSYAAATSSGFGMSPSHQDAPSDPASVGGTADARRQRWRRNDEDVRRWAEQFRGGATVLRIAEREKVAPSTVSKELRGQGFTFVPGHHMVEQLPLKYSSEFVQLIDRGPEAVLELLKERVWGIQASQWGEKKLRSFCDFVRLHHRGVGVKEIARRLGVHRTTVAHWREGTDKPYLVRALHEVFPIDPRPGWQLLPMHLTSGGGEPSGWIQVPRSIRSYEDILDVIRQIRPLERTFERAALFGLSKGEATAMRPELFAYLLGIMVGDSGKLGGELIRFASMNLDLQLTLKQPTNERLGEFVLLCANSIGLQMERKQDKQPTGATALGKNPSPAYRWASVRSPLLAWMFSDGLGLEWGETTTTQEIRMNWILEAPKSFRVRFVQGVADSDGCVKHTVEIASVPNSQFFADFLQGLGVTSAHVGYEDGDPLKTVMSLKQASTLPIFNEFVKSYRYRKLMDYTRRKENGAASERTGI